MDVTVDEREHLAERFEADRTHLRAVAYRMLGSVSEADDAVQEAWLRLNRSDAGEVENLRAWLTTVVARVALDMLRSRKSRREEPLGPRVPEPIVSRADGVDPEHQALLADSVGLALLVVLETLSPAERLAFVLHDMFAVPFDEIAPDRRPLAGRRAPARQPRAPPRARRRAGAGRRPRTPARAGRRLPRGRARRRLRRAAGGARPGRRRCASTAARCVRPRRARSAVRAPWPSRRGAVAGFAGFARPALVNGAAGFVVARARPPVSPSPASRSPAAGSSRSTSSPTPRGCASSTWRCWTASYLERCPAAAA